jgi:hypothetical protein
MIISKGYGPGIIKGFAGCSVDDDQVQHQYYKNHTNGILFQYFHIITPSLSLFYLFFCLRHAAGGFVQNLYQVITRKMEFLATSPMSRTKSDH